jgi:Flp pilus assembly protein TadD
MRGNKDKLIEQGMRALATCEPELAAQFFERAVTLDPHDAQLLDALADALLQTGRVAEAKVVLVKSTELDPRSNPAKWFYLAQLQSSGEALSSYTVGIRVLVEALQQVDGDATTQAAYTSQLSKAHSSVAELYLTDLCFEEDAERLCEEAVTQALLIDPSNLDGRLALASLRLSQSRPEESSKVAEELATAVISMRNSARARSLVQEFQGDDEQPDEEATLELCINLAKILLECVATHPALNCLALELLSSVVDDDDEQAEAWFLMGIAHARTTPPEVEDAKHCFENAKELMELLKGNMAEGTFPLSEQLDSVTSHLDCLENDRPLCFARVIPSTDNAITQDEEWSEDEDAQS